MDSGLGISTDDLSGARSIVNRIGLKLPILYDSAADVVRAYGVYDLLGDGLATPSTFILDKDGVIQWKYVGSRIYDRASTAQILEQLRMLAE